MTQPINGKGHRHPSYPYSPRWDECMHEWAYPFDAAKDTEVYCTKCECPGEVEDNREVYWPAT